MIHEIIENVAKGLRGLKQRPDAFVFVDGQTDWTWDEPEILGIPVYHYPRFIDTNDTGCLFVPVWKDEAKADPYTFYRQYEM